MFFDCLICFLCCLIVRCCFGSWPKILSGILTQIVAVVVLFYSRYQQQLCDIAGVEGVVVVGGVEGWVDEVDVCR